MSFVSAWSRASLRASYKREAEGRNALDAKPRGGLWAGCEDPALWAARHSLTQGTSNGDRFSGREPTSVGSSCVERRPDITGRVA